MRRPLILGALAGGRRRSPPRHPRRPWAARPASRACRIQPSPARGRACTRPPAPPPDDRAAHNGIFAALGRFTYRNRRWLPIAGLALVIGLNVWAATAGGTLSQGGWQIEGSEAAQAEALAADRFGEQATSLIVILTDPDGDAAPRRSRRPSPRRWRRSRAIRW